MTRKYTTSYKSTRGSTRRNGGGVSFDNPPLPADPEERLLEGIEKEETFIRNYGDGFPWLAEEAKVRLKYYRKALEELRKQNEPKQYVHKTNEFIVRLPDPGEQTALAHIDSLVGTERLTANQMNDAVELFTPRSYGDKHVPDGVCPLCGGVLIVREHKRRLRKGGDDITRFVACTNYELTGCRYRENFTPEIKSRIDNFVSSVDLDLGI